MVLPGNAYIATGTLDSVAVDIVIGVMIGFEMAAYSVGEATGPVKVKVIAHTGPGAGQPTSEATYNILPADGSATTSSDFFFVNISASFLVSNFSESGGPWQAEHSYDVTITNDEDDEDDETFDLQIERVQSTATYSLVDASGYSCGSVCTATVTIIDDDTAQVMGVTVDAGDAQLVVNWTAVDTATGYTVQWKSGGQGYNTDDRQATVTSGTTTSHTIEGLANGTEYTVRVIATRTDANDGPPSAEVTGTTDRELALTPSAVTVTEGGTATFAVRLASLPGRDTIVAVSSGNTGAATVNPPSLTFTPMTWNTAQTVTVTGVNDIDTSDEQVTITLSGDGVVTGTVTVDVTDNDTAQVTGVIVDTGDAQLVVNWTAVDNATGYTVQWKSGGQGYNTGDRQATVTPGSTTSHTIEGLANGTEYTVRVIATRTDANDGPPSAEVTGTTEMIPMPSPTLPEIALLLLAMLLLGSGVYLLRGRQSGGLTHA